MKFSAEIKNSPSDHRVMLRLGEKEQTLSIMPKQTGGSSISGGELFFLALATCYCKDIYREAAKRDIEIESVEIEVNGDFAAERQPATNIVYRAKVNANASEEEIRKLMLYVDSIAEIQNTVRVGTPIQFRI